MARTEEEIYDSLVARKDANAILSTKLTDTRDVAVFNNLFHIIAGEIAILEQRNDAHNLTVEDRALSIPAPVTPWFAWIAINTFQYGDSLVLNMDTGKYGYAVINEDRKIIDFAGSEEEGENVIVKCLKIVTDVATPLSGSEQTSLLAFYNKMSPPGTFVTVVSQEGDEVNLSATMEVDTNVIDKTGYLLSDGTTKPVEEAIEAYYVGYQTTNNFNTTFYLQDLEAAILAVNGVINVVVNICSIKPLGGSYVNVLISTLRKYTPAAGWLKEDSLNPLSSNLTYL